MKRKGLIVCSLLVLLAAGCAATSSPVAPAYPIVHQGGRGQGFRTHIHYGPIGQAEELAPADNGEK